MRETCLNPPVRSIWSFTTEVIAALIQDIPWGLLARVDGLQDVTM